MEREKNLRYANIRAIALTIGRAYEDVTLRGKVLTHMEFYLLLQLFNEYKLCGGNGACDFWMEELKRAHGYGSKGWDQYRKLGEHLETALQKGTM